MKKQSFRLPALTLALLMLLAMLAGCSAASHDSAMTESVSDAAMNSAAADSWDDVAVEEAVDDYADESDAAELTTGAASSASGADGQTGEYAQKIIYSGRLDIESTEFDSAVAAIDTLVADVGGFVESSELSGHTSYQSDGTTKVIDRWANYVIRVPSDRFHDTMSRAGSIGNVINSGKSRDNITSQFIDQEARRDSLAVQEERLLAMLEKSEDIETLVELEARLAEVRYEIESIERQLRNWQNQVDYSTVTIYLQEVAIYTPTAPVQRTFGEKLQDAFGDGWSNFAENMQDLVIFLIGSLPTLLILGVIAVVAILVVRKVRRRKMPKRPADPPASEEK